jgi:hypothetical protein
MAKKTQKSQVQVDYSKFKHANDITDTLKPMVERLEAMIAKHKDKIPADALAEFYEKFPNTSFVLNSGVDRLVPVQNKFTDEELAKFNEVLEKHNFKGDKIVDSLVTEKDKKAYHRHDYTVGNDKGLVYIIKLSATPVDERFDNGHYKNDYSIAMASAHGTGMPFPMYTRHKTMDELCKRLDCILS